MLVPLPGAVPTKPGSSAFPYFGVEPILIDENGDVLEGQSEGNLVSFFFLLKCALVFC